MLLSKISESPAEVGRRAPAPSARAEEKHWSPSARTGRNSQPQFPLHPYTLSGAPGAAAVASLTTRVGRNHPQSRYYQPQQLGQRPSPVGAKWELPGAWRVETRACALGDETTGLCAPPAIAIPIARPQVRSNRK